MANEPDKLPDDLLDRATAGLRQAPAPAGPSPELMNRTLAAMSAATDALNRRGRVWNMRGLAKFAAAAVVALALVGAILWSTSRSSMAFGDVLERVRQTRTLTLTLTATEKDQSGEQVRLLVKEPAMRSEFPDGSYSIMNKETGQSLFVDPAKKDATRMQLAALPIDFYGWLRDYHDGQAKDLGVKVIDGRTLHGFEAQRAIQWAAAEKKSSWTFWVDERTHLPVRIEVAEPGMKGTVVLSDLRFDVPLDDKLFDMGVPQGYAVHDLGGIATPQLAASPTTQEAQKLLLKPGVGIGPLTFGATKEQVIELLGQPEQSYRDVDLRYPSKGLAVAVFPKVGLQTINAFTREAVGPFAVNNFAGGIDKELAMGASRKQIEAAYGKPTTVTDAGGLVILHYADLNTYFNLRDDRLIQVTLMRPRKP